MSPNKYTASIVVTAFDREESLKRLLESLNHQSLPPEQYEVIIADDSAERNTGERVRQGVETRFSTTLVRSGLPYHVNGVSVARNRGIQAATGRIIISIDDDCVPNRYFVEEHLKFHKSGYPLIVLGHRSEKIGKLEEERPISVTETKGLSELLGSAADSLGFFNFMTGNISFPKEIVTKVGLFNETFAQPGEHGWEDIELGYRLWRKGYSTVFSRNAVVYRPATEREKEERRNNTGATGKALDRFLSMHPLLPWINRFLDACNRNDLETALGIGEKILEKDSDQVGVLIRTASLHMNSKNLPRAQECLSMATTLQPINALAQELYGEALYHLGRHEEALRRFQSALELDPVRTRSLYFLAHLKTVCRASCGARLAARQINVELGGGVLPTKVRAEGQDDFINLDIQSLPAVDVVRDFRQPLPLPDRSVRRIFSREMIEHLPHPALPRFLAECFRIMEPGGELYLCCPDFEAIVALYNKQCGCVTEGMAQPDCPVCGGEALISENYWRSNLLGNQQDIGDGGINDTHKNQITFPYLKGLLARTGFERIERDESNRFYEKHKKIVKLSVRCMKPPANRMSMSQTERETKATSMMQKNQPGVFLLFNPNGVVDRDICLALDAAGFQLESYPIQVSRSPEGHTLEKIDLLAIAKTILHMNPDFVLSVNGAGLDNEGLFARLCAFVRRPLVLWYVDEPFVVPEWGLKYIPETTVAFTFDRYYENRLRSWGIPWVYTLPLGANADRLHSYQSASHERGDYRHPVSFVGALEFQKIQYLLQNISRLWPDMPPGMVDVLDRTVPAYRNDFLRDTEEVLAACARELGVQFSFPNGMVRQMVLSYVDREAGFRQRHEIIESLRPFGVRVYGERFWEKAVGKTCYAGPVDYYSPEIASLYRSSRINLNISKYQLKTTVNQRVFDCPLCDGFLITDFREDLEEYLRIDKEVAVYRDKEELKKKISFFLENDGERRQIVENGKAAVLERHTYGHRLSKMADIVNAIKQTARFERACEEVAAKSAPRQFLALIDRIRQDVPNFQIPVPGRPIAEFAHST